jgi:hypothetical protein
MKLKRRCKEELGGENRRGRGLGTVKEEKGGF